MQTSFGAGGELVFSLRVDTSQANLDIGALHKNFVQLEYVALRYVAIARRLGLPDDIELAIQKMSQFILAARMLDLTLKSIQAGMGPIGWASLAATATMTGLSFYSLGETY